MSGQADQWSRRRFLASLAALGAAHLTAPARGLGMDSDRKIKLGFDNFSIRAFDWKAPRLIEYASSLNVDTLLLSDLDVYESLDEDYLNGDSATGRPSRDRTPGRHGKHLSDVEVVQRRKVGQGRGPRAAVDPHRQAAREPPWPDATSAAAGIGTVTAASIATSKQWSKSSRPCRARRKMRT